jgi:hypothetical protein
MPGEALMEMLYLAYGNVSWLQSEIAKQKDLTSFEARTLVQLHADERDRVAKVAATALAAGVQERQIRLAEMYGEIIARLISGVLGDLRLTPAQVTHSREVVRRHLLALDSGGEKPPPLDPPDVEGKAKRVAGRR